MPEIGAGDRKADGSGYASQRGVHAARLHDHKQTTKDGEVWRKRPQLSDDRGVQRELPRKRPVVAGTGSRTHRGLGVHRASLHELSRQKPAIGSTSSGGEIKGMGVHRETLTNGGLYAYFEALADRLRRVRVCCGDWRRVTGPSVTFRHGLTAVFLDPPYAHGGRADVYAYEHQIFEDVRAWAIENGPNPLLRIALCGYDFEMPAGWQCVRWKAHGGYGSQGNGRGRENAEREMVWFSPNCIDPVQQARDALSRPIAARASDWSGTMFEESDDA
jgi:DNA adenine methylase